MGLLDALGSDDAKLGIALLSASGYSPTPMSFGQRLGGALGQYNADKQSSSERALKLKLLQSQVDENASQNMLRQGQLERQKRQDEYFLGGPVAPMTAPGGGGVSAAPAAPTSVSPGSVLKSATGVPADAPPPGRGKFAEWSQQYGIPVDALVSDYMSNGGKGIADMLMKRGTPDMQVSNGYAYDKNKVGAGYLPQLNMSQDGKASMVQIGPDGLPVVSAPRGAVETFGAYQGQAANFKPIKVYNPQTGREEYTSEGAVVGGRPLTPMAGRPGNVQSPGYAGGDRNAANAESIRVMQAELQKPDLTAADRAGIQREIQRMQMQSGITNAQLAQTGAYAAGPSANEAAATAGRQATATSIGNKAGELLKESADQASGAVQAVQSAQRMQQALDSDKVLSGPTASLRLKGLQIAATLGMPGKDDAEKIANTRQAVQEMAKLTLAGRKQMSGQGAITNQESALAERATSGDIDSLTAPEIRQLANAAERTGRFQYEQHQAKLKAMTSDPAMAGNVALYQPPAMPDARPAAPVATLRFNPSTGKLEKVQ